jgi:hypothetical protein
MRGNNRPVKLEADAAGQIHTSNMLEELFARCASHSKKLRGADSEKVCIERRYLKGPEYKERSNTSKKVEGKISYALPPAMRKITPSTVVTKVAAPPA